jgi:penicillin-binding protein 1A
VVKQNFIGSESTLERKVAEATIAIELERRFTKEQILEYYLNSVYFGSNAYGITAAAQEYFGKPLDQLTVAEAAALPVPIRNPSLYNLRNDSDIPRRARDAVIDNMVEEGYITPADGEAAKAEPIVTVVHEEFNDPAPQVLIAARDTVLNDARYGLGATFLQRKRALFGCPADDTECSGGGGLKIYTTVNFHLQEEARRILQEWFPPDNDLPTGAIAMVDNRTGATLVMASGLDFGTDVAAGQRQYDLAMKGRRNPGSASSPSVWSPRWSRASHSTPTGTTPLHRLSTSAESNPGCAATPGPMSPGFVPSKRRSICRPTRCFARSRSRSDPRTSWMSPTAWGSSHRSERYRRSSSGPRP